MSEQEVPLQQMVARAMVEEKRKRDRRLCGVKLNKYIPHVPTPKQAMAMKLDNVLEVYYGGSAGGGKSIWLLMSALQHVEHKDYAALLLRRTYADLSLPGALMDVAYEWLRQTDAKWHDTEKTWKFPSGATLTFGYLKTEKDKYRYQSSQLDFIGFDESTQFSESQYTYLFSRLRRLKGSPIPSRMRSASNPDGEGLEWVRKRFIPEPFIQGKDLNKFDKVWYTAPDRVFIPARLEDNQYIDAEQYERSLLNLDLVTYARLREGDWEAEPKGELIRREWFGQDKYFPDLPEGAKWKVRAWDLAVTEKQVLPRRGRMPDYHASVKACVFNGDLWLGAPMLWRSDWADALDRLMAVMMNESDVTHGTGKALHETAAVQALLRKGYGLIQYPESKDKLSRAQPWINQARIGRVKLVGTPEQWHEFTHWWFKFGTAGAAYDDSVDVVSGVVQMLGFVFELTKVADSAHDPYAFIR